MTSSIILFSCHFESRKCEKKEKNYKNLNILGTKRAFLMKSKAFFIIFEGLSFSEKITNGGHKLSVSG